MSAPIYKPTQDDGLVRQLLRRIRFFGGVGGKDYTSFDSPGGFGFLTARGNAHLASNCYYDGTNWQRYDTTLSACVIQSIIGGGLLTVQYAPAGGNPITFTTYQITQATLAQLASADSGWTDVGSYAANWSAYDPTQWRPKYRKLSNGLVVFRGLVKKSLALVANENMFVMPAGYRTGNPESDIFDGANAAGYCELRTYSGGGFNLGGTIGAAGGNAYVALNGISYLAEN